MNNSKKGELVYSTKPTKEKLEAIKKARLKTLKEGKIVRK